jgi:hypothetical protein
VFVDVLVLEVDFGFTASSFEKQDNGVRDPDEQKLK